MVDKKRGRVKTKQAISEFEVHRKELKLAMNPVEKGKQSEFNPKAIENMKKNLGQAVNGYVDGLKEILDDTRKGSLFEGVTPEKFVENFDINAEYIDMPEGTEMFCNKGVRLIGCDMISSKKLMMLCVIYGMIDGLTLDELCMTGRNPGRTRPPEPSEYFKSLVPLFKNGWLEGLDADRGLDRSMSFNVLIRCTDKGKDRLKVLVDCLDPVETDLLRIGAERRIALIKRERQAGRGYSVVPKVDNTKPAYDRVGDVMKLAEYLMDKDIKAGGIVKGIEKE